MGCGLAGLFITENRRPSSLFSRRAPLSGWSETHRALGLKGTGHGAIQLLPYRPPISPQRGWRWAMLGAMLGHPCRGRCWDTHAGRCWDTHAGDGGGEATLGHPWTGRRWRRRWDTHGCHTILVGCGESSNATGRKNHPRIPNGQCGTCLSPVEGHPSRPRLLRDRLLRDSHNDASLIVAIKGGFGKGGFGTPIPPWTGLGHPFRAGLGAGLGHPSCPYKMVNS